MADARTPQHYRVATGQKTQNFKTGGSVPKFQKLPSAPSPPLKSGTPDTPMEKSRRANGIRNMKGGGRC